MSAPLITWQKLRAGHRSDGIAERPLAAVFRCSDAGVSGETIFGASAGSFIDISTWGHAIDFGVLASLEYAVTTLEVPLIVVLGHRDCPAIRTAMRAWNDAVLPDGATRTVVEQVFGSMVRRGAQAGSIETVSAATSLKPACPCWSAHR